MKDSRGSEIFAGLTDEEYNLAMREIDSGEFSFKRNKLILSAGDVTSSMGLVLEGSVLIESSDIWGNTSILGIAGAGDFFAETYALLGLPLMVDVRANEDSRVLFLKVSGMHNYSGTWSFKLMKNLLHIAARKNIHLSERSFITARKSIRLKVMSYLNSISIREQSRDIIIPFTRQQMADYLNTDRSALSKELCSMRDEGIIEFRKNHFSLKRPL